MRLERLWTYGEKPKLMLDAEMRQFHKSNYLEFILSAIYFLISQILSHTGALLAVLTTLPPPPPLPETAPPLFDVPIAVTLPEFPPFPAAPFPPFPDFAPPLLFEPPLAKAN